MRDALNLREAWNWANQMGKMAAAIKRRWLSSRQSNEIAEAMCGF